MLISPPFLPASTAGQTEAAFLEVAMKPKAGEGAYPVSQMLAWHNGIHIEAPRDSKGKALPVRAIADGKVVFAKDTSPPEDGAPAEGAYYNPWSSTTPAWTSSGMVVIQHETEIGAAGTVPTKLVYYSAYVHLKSLGKAVKVGSTIYRKDIIGEAGSIYGDADELHFEICMDDTNLKALMGSNRPVTWTARNTVPTANGRTDSVWGSSYVYLPVGVPLQTATPTNHMRDPSPTQTLTAPQWVQMDYQQGSAAIVSYDKEGKELGRLAEAEAEYKLYKTATDRHNSLGAVDRLVSSPSAWYELLRFGRNLGTDTLPPSAAHWRKINTPQGDLWADLNAAGTFKFSDADFLLMRGWQCIDDDTTTTDQRCDSAKLKDILVTGVATPAEKIKLKADSAALSNRANDPAVAPLLRRAICKFPTEWDKDTISARCSWVKDEPEFKDEPEAWKLLEAHINAITHSGLPQAYKNAQWHFHPAAFIGMLRRCGWLGKEELARIYPNTVYPLSALAIINTTPESIHEKYLNHVNFVIRKYGINTATQKTHFFGQGAVESMCLALMVEGSASFTRNPLHASFNSEANGFYNPATNSKDYLLYLEGKLGNIEIGDGPKYRGRGMKQLTGRENYSKYWVYRGWLDKNTFTSPWWNPSRPNIAPQINAPQKLSINDFSAIDAGGWYWDAGSIANQSKSINKAIQENDITDATIEKVTRAINGGINGLSERKLHTKRISLIVMDEI